MFGLLLNKITSPLLMGLLYYGLMTPYGCILRCLEAVRRLIWRTYDPDSTTIEKPIRAVGEGATGLQLKKRKPQYGFFGRMSVSGGIIGRTSFEVTSDAPENLTIEIRWLSPSRIRIGAALGAIFLYASMKCSNSDLI